MSRPSRPVDERHGKRVEIIGLNERSEDIHSTPSGKLAAHWRARD